MAHDRISQDPAIMGGKPVIKGTRITVEHILRECAAGVSVEDYVDQHPHITVEDVRAALAYAADHMRTHWTHAAE
jgi:uncharacterized protein (DUF433 family)